MSVLETAKKLMNQETTQRMFGILYNSMKSQILSGWIRV